MQDKLKDGSLTLERTRAWLKLTMRTVIYWLRTVALEDVLDGKGAAYARVIGEGVVALVVSDAREPQPSPKIEEVKPKVEVPEEKEDASPAKRGLRHRAAVGAVKAAAAAAAVVVVPPRTVELSRELQYSMMLSNAASCPEVLLFDHHRLGCMRAEFDGITTHLALAVMAQGTLAKVQASILTLIIVWVYNPWIFTE